MTEVLNKICHLFQYSNCICYFEFIIAFWVYNCICYISKCKRTLFLMRHWTKYLITTLCIWFLKALSTDYLMTLYITELSWFAVHTLMVPSPTGLFACHHTASGSVIHVIKLCMLVQKIGGSVLMLPGTNRGHDN